MRLFVPPATKVERSTDGSTVLSSSIPLEPYATSMAALFRAAADSHPGRVLVAEREGDGWREVTYQQARLRADGYAQALIDRGAAGRPVMILSGNSIEHLLVTLACYTVGSPVIPVTTAYSLLDRTHAKLREMAELTDPAVIFTEDPEAYAPALQALGGASGELSPVTPAAAVEDHFAEVRPDSIAKILFTSGSTGRPKGVVNTHRMLCANQQMLRQIWPFLAEEPPVLLDWLPWSHTFGGNHNVGLVLAGGGTLYIDDGRPAPGLVERTVRNLAEVRPTLYFSVPAGYAALLPYLERDRALAEAFFSRLRFVFYAAAALPQQVWEGIEKVAASVGATAPMTTSWGATETAPAATSAHFPSRRSDCIGVPLPGVSIKLAPVGEKLEVRVKGPTVTPGYFRRPDLTRVAFDEEGFYYTGDAVCLLDQSDPDAGLRFDGRIAEDFKLATGTWVSVGTLRTALISASDGLIGDAVLTGHDRDQVGALLWLNPARARHLAGEEGDPASHPGVREAVAEALARLEDRAEGSSQRVARALIMSEPASLADGEITDKGYVNQRAVLDRRAELVELLHRDPSGDEVITPRRPATPPSGAARADATAGGGR